MFGVAQRGSFATTMWCGCKNVISKAGRKKERQQQGEEKKKQKKTKQRRRSAKKKHKKDKSIIRCMGTIRSQQDSR